MDSTHKIVYGVILGFLATVFIFVSLALYWSCSSPDVMCIPNRSLMTLGTPIPTLIPAPTQSPLGSSDAQAAVVIKCRVAAIDLLGSWVSAKYPESDSFTFTDTEGKSCTGTYEADIKPLFNEANLWYNGAPACGTCHNANVETASAKMNLSDYAGILNGSGLSGAQVDVLGGGNWMKSLMYDKLMIAKTMPLGRAADVNLQDAIIYAGVPVE